MLDEDLGAQAVKECKELRSVFASSAAFTPFVSLRIKMFFKFLQ